LWGRYLSRSIAYLILFSCVLFCSSAGFCEEALDESPKVHIEGFNVTGNTVIDTGDILSTLSKYKDAEYTLEEMDTIAQAVTMLYHEKGYILARAFIPSQRMEGNTLEIAVLEGKLGSIQVSNTRYYKESYIRGFFKHLVGRPVNEFELEEAVLIANRTPQLKTAAVLKKGATPGTSDLLVNVEDAYAINLAFSFDNHGHPIVSRNKYALSFDVTDPHIGSTLSLGGSIGESADDTTAVSINYRVPVNRRGTSVGVKYSYSDFIVGGNFQPLGIEGDARIYGVYATHEFIRSKRKNLSATVGFDYKRIFAYILDTQQSNDDLSVAYLGLNFDAVDRLKGKTFANLTYSHGFSDLFGSLGENDPARSRFGAGGKFDKIFLNLTRLQAITKDIALSLKLSGQLSSDRLVGSEKFAIGGANTVRGHASSRYSGDHGYVFNAEFTAPLPYTHKLSIKGKKLSDILRVALFFDHGGTYVKDPIIGEGKDEYLTSAGIGARIFLFNRLFIKLDVGYPIVNGDLETDDEIVYILGKFKILTF
jgi:hemolysin activation/secretion protein